MKNILFSLAFILASIPQVLAAQPVSLYDASGHPISSTFSGGNYYLNVSATLNETATAAPGAPGPAVLKVVAGEDGLGNVYPLLTDNTGKLQITSSSASVGATGSAVPSNADFIGAKNGSGNLVGLLTGQQTMANSLACVLPSDQSAIPVTGTFWQATQPVSVASLPLPTGAATSANQSTEITALGAINTTLGSPFQAGGTIGNTSFGISGTLPAFASTPTVNLGTLNGASTAANQSTIITDLATINTTLGSPFQAGASIGNTSFGISGTLPAFAAIPSFKIDQTTPGTTNGVQVNAALPAGTNIIGSVTLSGSASANSPVYNDYTSTGVTTSSYVQLVASTSNAISRVEIFDSSGQALYFATGAAASEVNQFIITPGGNGQVPISIPSGTRISVKAITATANSGFIVMNFYK